MLKCLIPVTLFLSSCVTTPTARLTEPDHSNLMMLCLNNNVFASACACAEQKAVEDTGLRTAKSQEDAYKFIESFRSFVEECNRSAEQEAEENAVLPEA